MSKHFKENKKDLAYYFTTFKLEGHSTWRAYLSQDIGGFDKEQKNWPAHAPKVTERHTMRFNRLTGAFEAL